MRRFWTCRAAPTSRLWPHASEMSRWRCERAVVSDARSRLVAAGMSEHEAERKQALLDKATASLLRLTDVAAGIVFRSWVPGRIEFLGKHTDYAGGRSLLCAAERGICVAVTPRRDDRLRVYDAITGEMLDERMSQPAIPEAASAGHSATHVRTVPRRLGRNFQIPFTWADVA